jgi:cathepsin A (carboxypeptidase C)
MLILRQGGDGMHNTAALIPEMLKDGIRFLIYAGEYDFSGFSTTPNLNDIDCGAVCNWLGNKRWALALDSPFKAELAKAKDLPFYLANGTAAGEV